MADRVSSDSVPTVRAKLQKHGATDRLRIELPAEEAEKFPEGEVVRVMLDGKERHARIESHLTSDGLVIAGVFDTPSAAREKSGDDRLAEWCSKHNRSAGGSVLVDIIEDAFQYGVRAPGDRAFYTALEKPSDSLASIAEDIED
ncbi:DUF7112 family protein [Haloarchaeobius sp. TZWSO28]|uniref:DUF7112 family protein n=1 Tax=Haloarchaeobius sp. TZWSO28 TaxID=3446119 RepID=UPI003EB9953F